MRVVSAGLALSATGAAFASAQTKLDWAHVYAVTEPFHTESVRAAEEIEKRTDGRDEVAVFPRLAARQGGGHQPGAEARHGRHDHLRLQLRGPGIPADRRDRLTPASSTAPGRLLAYTQNKPVESLGYNLADWEAIKALQ